MRKLVALVLAAVVVVGCAGAGTPGETVGRDISSALKYLHDDKHGVGCWFIVQASSTSIACLPDDAYNP